MSRVTSILPAFAAAVFSFGCSEIAPVPEKTYVNASFEVSMDEPTKASDDNDALAGNVNRCVLQIWNGNEIYKTVVRTAPSGTRYFSFKGVTLSPEDTYDFLFWADCGTSSGGDLFYSTESLKNVRMLDAGIGNDDALDAFCNCLSGCRIDDEYKADVVLRRPLSQLNVVAGDLPGMALMPFAGDFRPESVSFSYYGCTAYDVLGKTSVGEPVLISVDDVPLYGTSTLAMNYLFPYKGESVSTVNLTIRNSNGSTVTSSFDNVPFKSNYRTNIIGNLLSVKCGFEVILVPMFDGEMSRD